MQVLRPHIEPVLGGEFASGNKTVLQVGNTTDGFIESSTLTTTASIRSCAALPTSSCVTEPHLLGGTSGIVIDNQVSSGGTNIYFSTLALGSVNGQNCHLTGGLTTPYCAVKLTQAALQ